MPEQRTSNTTLLSRALSRLCGCGGEEEGSFCLLEQTLLAKDMLSLGDYICFPSRGKVLVCPRSRPGAGPSWWLPGVGNCPQGQHQKCPVMSLHSSGYRRDSISISCFPWKHAERGSVGSTWDRDQDRFGAVSAHYRRPFGARVLPDGGRVTG